MRDLKSTNPPDDPYNVENVTSDITRFVWSSSYIHRVLAAISRRCVGINIDTTYYITHIIYTAVT